MLHANETHEGSAMFSFLIESENRIANSVKTVAYPETRIPWRHYQLSLQRGLAGMRMFHVTCIFPLVRVYGLFPCNRFTGFGVKGMKSTGWSSNYLLTGRVRTVAHESVTTLAIASFYISSVCYGWQKFQVSLTMLQTNMIRRLQKRLRRKLPVLI